MEVLRQYGTAATILFPLITRDSQDFRTSGITFVAADTQISKDEGAFANTGSTPSHEGNGMYSLALTAVEMQAARIMITCVDAATKLWEDQAVIIQTYGNASAGFELDLDVARVAADATAVDGSTTAAANLSSWADNGILPGTVDNTAFTPTATEFESDDITESTADAFINRTILVLSGTNQYATTQITDYVLTGGRGHFTHLPFRTGSAVGNNDTFLILGADSPITASMT